VHPLSLRERARERGSIMESFYGSGTMKYKVRFIMRIS
jgi:hypothetical protein